MKLSRTAALGVALLACVLLEGCMGTPTGSPAPPSGPPFTTSTGSSAYPSEQASSTTTLTAPRRDHMPLAHSISTGGRVIRVKYSTTPAVADWTVDGPKSVRVALTVVKSPRRQKVYLTKATVGFRSDDYPGDLPGASPVVDAAWITPGYLVASPYSYGQAFAVPSLEPRLSSLRLDFKYELVTLVDGKAKDYTKQAVSDSVSLELPF